MNAPLRTERDYEELSSRLLDVLIRAGMILVIVLLCYRIFSPFLTLMVWALILAVAIYPLHRSRFDGSAATGVWLAVSGLAAVAFAVALGAAMRRSGRVPTDSAVAVEG